MALTVEQLEEIKSLIATAAYGGNGTPAPPGGWSAPQPASSLAPPTTLAPRGVLVPIKVQTPNGALRVCLEFGPELAATPQTLMSALGQLAAAGLPLDVWTKHSWGARGGNGWNRGGGW